MYRNHIVFRIVEESGQNPAFHFELKLYKELLLTGVSVTSKVACMEQIALARIHSVFNASYIVPEGEPRTILLKGLNTAVLATSRCYPSDESFEKPIGVLRHHIQHAPLVDLPRPIQRLVSDFKNASRKFGVRVRALQLDRQL